MPSLANTMVFFPNLSLIRSSASMAALVLGRGTSKSVRGRSSMGRRSSSRTPALVNPYAFACPFGQAASAQRRAAFTRSNVSHDIGTIRVDRDPAYCGLSFLCRLVWKNTVRVPATSPCCRSFSAARVICAVMAWNTVSKSNIGWPDDRVTAMPLRWGSTSSKARHASPWSSSTVRSKTTVPTARACFVGIARRSAEL